MSRFNGFNEGAFDYYPWNRLRRYVDEHYSHQISLVKAAHISGLGTSSFCTFFHESIGINFTDWLRRVRISKAIELMKTSDLSITEIAHEVGYAKMITFEREFKNCTLATLKEFKKSLRPD